MKSLNLASRPFRNDRLPSLLAVASLVVVLALSAYHLLLAREVMPDRTSGLTMKLGEMEAESARLRNEAASMRNEKPDPGALAQWTQLKDLVDRRVFSWTVLFSVLEDTLPDGVRLVTLQPTVEKGQVRLQITATARTFEEAMEFTRDLEDRPEFAEVWPTNRGSDPELEYRYDMKYLPPNPKPAM